MGFSTAIDALPYFIMEDQGIARKAGLTITTVPLGGGAGTIAAMAADMVDAGYVGSIPILQAASDGLLGPTVMNVAANTFSDPSHPGGAVIVSAKVKSWKDLEGGYIAVNTPTSLGGWGIVGRLRSEGVNKYTLVDIPFENMGLAVAGGNVTAAVMFEPFITQSIQRGDGTILGWVIGGPPLESIQLSVLTLRTGFVKDHAAAAKALVGAHVQAVRWLLGHEKAARALVGKGLSIPATVTADMRLLQWRADCRNDPAIWQSTQATVVGLGLLNKAILPSALYDETLLDAALKALR